MGDSHVSADFLPDRLRGELGRKFGYGGRGFLPVGTPLAGFWPLGAELGQSQGWKGSNMLQRDLGVAEPLGGYGLGGGALCGEEKGLEAWASLSDPAAASQGVLYYAAFPRGGSFEVTAGNVAARRVSSAAESLSVQELPFRLGKTQERSVRVRTLGDGSVCLLGVVFEKDKPGVVVDALGVAGARLPQLPVASDPLFRQMLAARGYHLLVLAYGTNEAEDVQLNVKKYTAAVGRTLAELRKAAPNADCLLLGPPLVGAVPESPSVFNPRLAAVVAALREAALAGGCAFFDSAAAMGGGDAFPDWLGRPEAALNRLLAASGDFALARELRGQKPVPGLYTGDAVHLLPAGYGLVAQLFFDALVRSYYQYRIDAMARPPGAAGRR